jgi:hypothetical protein
MKRRTYLSSLAASTIIPSTQTQPTEEEIKQALGEYQFVHETSEYIEFFYTTLTLRVYYFKTNRTYTFNIGDSGFHKLPNLKTTERAVIKAKNWEYEQRQETQSMYVSELSHTKTEDRIQKKKYTDDRENAIYYNETKIQEADIIPIVLNKTGPAR